VTVVVLAAGAPVAASEAVLPESLEHPAAAAEIAAKVRTTVTLLVAANMVRKLPFSDEIDNKTLRVSFADLCRSSRRLLIGLVFKWNGNGHVQAPFLAQD
jgi:hypothetical protein